MAFQSTSERYEYIYGTSVKELDRDTGEKDVQEDAVSRTAHRSAAAKKRVSAAPARKMTRTIHSTEAGRKKAAQAAERRAEEARLEELRPARKTQSRFLEWDRNFTITVAAAVLICAFAGIFYVSGTNRLSNMSSQISRLKTEKTALESRQIALQSEIDKSINLDEIREYAETELNMVMPSSSQILYYQDDSSDYFRQYESVDAR